MSYQHVDRLMGVFGDACAVWVPVETWQQRCLCPSGEPDPAREEWMDAAYTAAIASGIAGQNQRPATCGRCGHDVEEAL